MIKPKREKNLKFKDGKWYLDFTSPRGRVRKFCGFTKEQALNAVAKLRLERMEASLGFQKPLSREQVPFDKFADDFLEL
jgi:hypothetical protein